MSTNFLDLDYTDIGQVTAGNINGNRVHIAWSLKSVDLDELHLVISYQDGEDLYVSLDVFKTDGREGQQTFEFDATRVVVSMAVVVSKDNERYLLPVDSERYFLDRLLSSNMVEVNRNLRWGKRITHLPTRFFASLNSIKANPENFELQARCLVSVGYQGIENEDQEIISWAQIFCAENLNNAMSCEDAEVRASFLIFWAHLAIYSESTEVVLQISDVMNDALMGMEEYPVGAANALNLILLIGGILLFAGRHAEAQRVFLPFDRYIRIAANKYPRAPVNYRELIGVAERTYLCKLGLEMAKKRDGQLDQLLSSERAWADGNRLRSKGSKESCKMKFMSIIRSLEASS
ncbi:hypothetical protein [Thioclava sp. GXIMD2076]|uniref:hypothetical protein n=1 Tax=Thioclava sp. GXIMD2076 TaxID=3131931 RepID=UPI0030CEA1EC